MLDLKTIFDQQILLKWAKRTTMLNVYFVS